MTPAATTRTARGIRVLVSAVLAALWFAAGTGPQARAAPVLPSSTGWPLPGVPEVVRGFDPPDRPWGAGHRGVDLAGQPGEPVLAAAAGTVSFAGRLAGRGVMTVDHGPVRTTYEPVTPTVPVGTRVAAGQQIGTLDAGHCPDQPCLHWGLKQGRNYLDPLVLAPSGAAGGHYRLVPASESAAVRQRAAQRQTLLRHLTAPVGPAGAHGFRYPVAAPITSPYGLRLHPVLHIWKLHDGTDFGAACGSPIRAPYPGVVVQRYANAGYGNRLMLDHGTVDGRHVITGFNHAVSYVVGIGDRVRQGQLLGYVGTTGYSTGCHLHLVVWVDGQVVDPMTWY
jgi:murein DD-endopeptidase MepM/ murein hydrolase activator NlpD